MVLWNSKNWTGSSTVANVFEIKYKYNSCINILNFLLISMSYCLVELKLGTV
jgi:hypothetical protein